MDTLIRESALKTIQIEADSVKELSAFINDQFIEVVKLIQQSKGRLVISGIGKSAIIAQKIVATLNSTGTPSLFMHAADAIHGDLGMIQNDDLVILISKSGESPEIKVLVPLIKSFGNTIIALCGNKDSFLVDKADYFLNTTIKQEACPNNLAPTSSTTVQLVMGDALAVCLMNLNRFGNTEFAKFHPGGNLGKRLYLRVFDLINKNEKPFVNEDASLNRVIVEITEKRLGVTAVTNKKNEIIGIITDGDLRRMLEKTNSLDSVLAKDIMTVNPLKVESDLLAVDAFEIMKKNDISQLLVHQNNHYLGVLHLHDLIKEGII